MKRILALIVLALLGFYVVWPAWSGYRMVSALQSGDAALLESKIDFPSIRRGLRPVVEGEVNKELDKQMAQLGPGAGALLGGDVKKQMAPKLTELVLEKVVTGQNVIRIAREGGNVAGSVQAIIMEQMAKGGLTGLPGIPGLPSLPGVGGGGALGGALGGILGAAGASGRLPGGLPGFGGAATPAPAAPAAPAPQKAEPKPTAAARPSYGLGNVKSFGWSPLAYTLGVARDPAAAKADARVTLQFKDFDWKITDLVPQL